MSKQAENGNIRISATDMAVMLGQMVAITNGSNGGKSFQEALEMVTEAHGFKVDESIFDDAMTVMFPASQNGKSLDDHNDAAVRLHDAGMSRGVGSIVPVQGGAK